VYKSVNELWAEPEHKIWGLGFLAPPHLQKNILVRISARSLISY
jgi:hypothetical protein